MAEKLLVQFSGRKNLSKYVRILVAGEAGSKATKFALTAPDPIWAAVYPDWNALAKKTDTPYVDIKSEDDLLDLKTAIQDGKMTAKTVVIDRIDELQRRMFMRRMISEKRDFLKNEDWNWMEAKLNQIAKGFCDLEVNVVFIAATKDMGGFDGQDLVTKPDIQGGFSTDIYSYVDYAVHISPAFQLEGETYPPSLRTQPTHRYPWAFDRTDTLTDPVDLTFNDDFDKILTARQNMEVKEAKDPMEIVFADIETPEEKEILPGMSKDDKLNKILNKNKSKK